MKATKVFQKNWLAYNSGKAKYIINSGSSRSSKTFSILQIFWLIAWSKPRMKLSVFRYTKKDCKDTILQDMLKYYVTLPDYSRVIFNKTESYFTFPNGSQIFIEGTDDELKVHGYHSDILWFNEFYRISKDTFDQLDMRCSGAIFLDYNPVGRHWIDDTMKQDNAIVIHSTFKDNPFVPEQQKNKILSYEPTEYNIQQGTADYYKWQVYGLGLKAEKPNKIYHDWKEIDKHTPFENIPYPSYYGLDFGSRNPSALVEVKFDGENTFFIRELFYTPRNEMNVSLGKAFESIIPDKRIPLVCDYAEPDAIFDLRKEGYNAIPCNAKNVKNTIAFVQNATVYAEANSENLWSEYESYEWEIVQNVNLERPLKKDDHLLDALRYVMDYIKIVNRLA